MCRFDKVKAFAAAQCRRRGGHPAGKRRPHRRARRHRGHLDRRGTLAAFGSESSPESAGFGSAEVIVLLCVSAAGLVAFGWRERRAKNPLLDLRFLRIPQFTTSNIVAFCTYFSAFAIFFFTALYLVIVVSPSGYRLALVFLPMMVLMIVASVLAGWTAVVG